ncbi:tRNA uridine-5-carboxymethylaminomethyl(34) synthesis GTPase MnmE [Parvicella tangerina]|uniref:tRNA modification GTPase MnmE n=1 Tax=Parvicella tangerina TaxID=2829795 RepID=A0A916NTZ9_9FLAO|nr:tRNA uridine-5-carboxymethylaminomethyl(34) synthesis GTPase MnmE [Parvicella tangerina]CAG5086708.1 tRNA modification GTPase MnmE [Parvicella tangerina]
MKQTSDDIICAISSPPGVGAIALIRLSGKGAIELANELFSKDILNATPYQAVYGTIQKEKKPLDEVVLTVFRAPHSFTGEDIIEIACHGSSFIQNELLNLLVETGARIAEPGEFSKRAFYNGKMDLSQTEAIADLIHAESEGAHRLAMTQMKGAFGRELSVLREELIRFASLVELELDFAEEDVEFADRTELVALVTRVLSRVEELKRSFKTGTAIKDGVSVAIVGKPNAGKSSWINALTKDDVAIVSDIAGTTRDKIEVPIFINGLKFRLIDTAGLRDTDDIIEGIGVQRAKEVIAKSQIVMLLFDLQAYKEAELREAIDDIKVMNSGAEVILLGNKKDLADPEVAIENVIKVNAKSSEDCNLVMDLLSKASKLPSINKTDLIVTNARHYEALKEAADALQKAKEGLENKVSGDFVAMDIRQGIHHLGSITGEITTDNLLGHIFQNFCIGK